MGHTWSAAAVIAGSESVNNTSGCQLDSFSLRTITSENRRNAHAKEDVSSNLTRETARRMVLPSPSIPVKHPSFSP